MQETNSSGNNDKVLEFRNPDGSLASWTESVSIQARRNSLVKRTLLGLAVACWIWGVQWQNGAFDFGHVGVGAIPIFACFVWGYNVCVKQVARRYTTTDVRYSQQTRLSRAWKWWAVSVLCFAIIWGAQYATGRLAEYWWYAWPMTAFLLVGAGLYMLKGERLLTPEASKAKSYYDAENEKLKRHGKVLTGLDVLMEMPAIRYPLALLCLYGAYYFSIESTDRRSGVVAVVMVFLGIYLAREVSKWLLGFGAIFALGWALFAGMAALPLSAAVIIGALIIAGSRGK